MGPSYLNPNFKLSRKFLSFVLYILIKIFPAECEEILKSVAPVESDLQSGSMLQPLKKFG